MKKLQLKDHEVIFVPYIVKLSVHSLILSNSKDSDQTGWILVFTQHTDNLGDMRF